MQKLFFEVCFVAFVLSFSYCNKEKARQAGLAQLQGTWELRQAQNGMTPNVVYQPGNGNRLRFTDTSYQRYTNGTLTASGAYHPMADTTVQQEVGLVVEAGQFTRRIVFENDTNARKTFFQINGNQLKILSGYFPLDSGSNLVYEKVDDNPSSQ